MQALVKMMHTSVKMLIAVSVVAFSATLLAVALLRSHPQCGATEATFQAMLDTADPTTIVGVYEQRVITHSPYLLIQGPRSVSVISRYWGRRPNKVGRVAHGTIGPGTGDRSCFASSPEGSLAYAPTLRGQPAPRAEPAVVVVLRPGETLDGAAEAMLEQRFGSAEEVQVATSTRVLAWLQLWSLPLAAGALALAIPAFAIDFGGIRRRRLRWRPVGLALAAAMAVATSFLAATPGAWSDAAWMLALMVVTIVAARVGAATGTAIVVVTMLAGTLSGPLSGVTAAQRWTVFGGALVVVGMTLLAVIPEWWLRRLTGVLVAGGASAVGASFWNVGSLGGDNGPILAAAIAGLAAGGGLVVLLEKEPWRAAPEHPGDD